jgi:hypothetical protein
VFPTGRCSSTSTPPGRRDRLVHCAGRCGSRWQDPGWRRLPQRPLQLGRGHRSPRVRVRRIVAPQIGRLRDVAAGQPGDRRRSAREISRPPFRAVEPGFSSSPSQGSPGTPPASGTVAPTLVGSSQSPTGWRNPPAGNYGYHLVSIADPAGRHRGGSSAGQSRGLIIPGSRVRAPPALQSTPDKVKCFLSLDPRASTVFLKPQGLATTAACPRRLGP